MMVKKALLFLLAAFCIAPIILLFCSSFIVDGKFSLLNYGLLLLCSPALLTGFWRSCFYTVVILLFNIPLAISTAYGLTRFSFKGGTAVRWLNILIMLLPFQATLVPQYLTLNALGILNTGWAVILPGIFATFGSFLLTQYLSSFDSALYDAGQIDGLNNFKMLTKIVVPVAKPLIIGVAALSFINYWSMIEPPLVFLKTQSQMPLSVLLNSKNVDGVMNAAGILFCVLPLLIFAACHSDIKQGISLYGSTKEQKTAHGNYKKSIFRGVACFIAFIVVCSLVTQKLNYLKTTEVSVYTLSREGAISGNVINIPGASVFDGAYPYVYVAEENKLSAGNFVAVKKHVTVMAKRDNLLVINGAFENDSQIICFSNKELSDNMPIRIVEEAYTGA